MKFLYEPVAVRCRNRIFLALLPQKGDKPLDFSEKAKNVHRVEILADRSEESIHEPDFGIVFSSHTSLKYS